MRVNFELLKEINAFHCPNMLATAEKSLPDMDVPRPNVFRTNVPPSERYLQLSDWKSGTNCSSSGTCAGKEIFILDL